MPDVNMAGVERDTAGSVWMAAAALLLVSIGSAANQADVATLVLLLAATAMIAAVLAPRIPILSSFTTRSTVLLLGIGIGLNAFALPTRTPIPSIAYVITLLVLAAIGFHAFIVNGRWRLVQLSLLTIGHFSVMAWMIGLAGEPHIDVFAFQQQGAEAILHGDNPFAMSFEIDVDSGSPFYTPEVVEGNRLNFGFIYPPLSLLMAVPGYLIAGDYRYGAAAALALAALLIALIRPGRFATAGACLLLFTPMAQQVIFWGWTDPFVILLLATTILLAVKRAVSSPIAIGLLLASKQYMVPIVILAAVLFRSLRERVGLSRLVAVPLGVATVTVLPFLIWDVGAFFHSTVGVHLLQPFRVDSLSIPAALVRAGLPELPSALNFVAASFAMGLVLWRAPRTPMGFCLGTAVVLMAFFLFSKQAFMHYYFLVLAALACGIAAADLPTQITREGMQPRGAG